MLKTSSKHPHSLEAAISIAGYFGKVLRRLLRNVSRAHLKPTFNVNCKQKQSDGELATRWFIETTAIRVKASVYNIGWRSAIKNWLEDEEIAWNGEQMMCGHSFKVIQRKFSSSRSHFDGHCLHLSKKSRTSNIFRPINDFSITVSWDLRS